MLERLRLEAMELENLTFPTILGGRASRTVCSQAEPGNKIINFP
jgi:hypothetical protein